VKTKLKCLTALGASVLSLGVQSAGAADWSDTSIGWRYGTKFAEPFNNSDIKKNIINFTHASGYSLGTNFFNVDYLMSDKNDPAAPGSSNGAAETYIVYRNTLDIGKIAKTDIKAGPIKGVGVTLGFDVNSKTDAGYNSKKRMLVLGPTMMIDVPGFLNISVLVLKESNAPHNDFSGTDTPRYSYKTHPMLDVNWGIFFGPGFSFEGYADYIASKGKDEFGGNTAPETHADVKLMYNITSLYDAKKNTFKVGLEYEYWKNKFGNNHNGPAGKGAFAKTPMVKAEYHF
jgi:hypothetical protein